MNKKSILEILVLHQSFLEHKNSKEAYEVIREEAQKINEGETYKNLPKIRVDDWELSQPDSGSIQNLEKIKEDADNANAVFIIADGNISPDTKKWYESAIKESLNEASKRQVRIPVFWNISTEEYKKNFKEFCNSGSKHDYDKRDKLYPYDTLEIEPNANAPLRPQVASLLIQLANKWAAMINREETIPTLMSNRIRRNKRKKALIITTAFIIALGLLFYFLWPRIKDVRDKKAFGQRLANVEALISEKQYEPARDSLNILDSLCAPQWQDLREHIKKLKESIPSPPIFEPGVRYEQRHDIPSPIAKRIEDNTFEVIGVESPLLGYLCKSISTVIPNIERPSEGSTERWTISVEQDVSILEVPKLIESDEFMIDIEYSYYLKDNISGKKILENTISTRGKSPASKEDAKKHSRQLAAEEIANQIKDIIR